MAPMPEIDVEDAIKYTYTFVRTDWRYLNTFFGNRPPQSQMDIYRFFKNETINIGPAYSRDERTLPAISVLAGDGGTIDNYVGDYLGSILDDDEMTTNYIIGERDRGVVRIEVASLNNHQTSYMAAFVKSALLLNKPSLSDMGLQEMTFDWQEVEINTQITAVPTFILKLSVSFTYNTSVAENYGPTPQHITGIDIIPIEDPETVSAYDMWLHEQGLTE